MLVAFWVLQRLRESLPGRPLSSAAALRVLDRCLATAWRPLWLALPTVPILLAGHNRFGIDAIMDRQNSFAPEPIRLLYNAVFFAVGVGLYRARHDLDRFARLGMAYLGLSVPVFAVRAWLIDRHLTAPLEGPAVLALAASGALFAWLTTFGLLGVTLRFFDRPNRVVRYLADSSYWIYLIHLPVIGLV